MQCDALCNKVGTSLPSRANNEKIVLVLFCDLIKVTATMKRSLSLVVLLGLLVGAMMLSGCNQESGSTPPASTNAPAGTNAPA